MYLGTENAQKNEKGRVGVEIQAFGYLGIGSDNVEDWSAFAPAWPGMQEVDRGGGARAFRMDNRKQRLTVCRSRIAPGTQVFGWGVANAAAREALASRLEAARVVVKREPLALAD
jgi:hypothetical protein